jgi:hypothetical protein
MNIAVALVLGLLLGWLIEWAIDWFYWRRVRSEPGHDASTISRPTPDPFSIPAPFPDSFGITAAPEREKNATPPTNPDDLTVIKGIGPVIAKRLNQAGIYTYEQLAELTQDEFEQALGNLLERFINERFILRQARELAGKKETG